jgi:hypothetical protein
MQLEAKKVVENMTECLKMSCESFAYKSFSEKIVEASLGRIDDNPNGTTLVVAGKTQAGKSSVIGVVQMMCFLMGYALIVITKGVAESCELHAKLKNFFEGTPFLDHIVCVGSPAGKNPLWKNKKHEAQVAIEAGGTLVVADTYEQLKKAIKAIENYREGEDKQKGSLSSSSMNAMQCIVLSIDGKRWRKSTIN